MPPGGLALGEATPAAAAAAQHLTFLLGTDLYAIGIMFVKEIIEYRRVTPVPMMPAWIRGVINLRGAVVPVMDLAARFQRPPAAITQRTCIVVVELEGDGERRQVGVMVDAVSAVLDIAAADIEPPPTLGGAIHSQLAQGMGKIDGRFVVILDTERVMADGELGISETSGTTERSEDVP
jgi:purine-binding chemotaxis protein CheW